MQFDNSYARELEGAFVPWQAAAAPRPRERFFNAELAAELGGGLLQWEQDKREAVFSGQLIPPGAQPIAQAYAGHQFGGFSPQLGDGRALLLGEVLAECGAPAGQIAFLPFGHEHVDTLLRDPRVKMLSFTGGVDVGWQLKAKAVKQKVTLELGGNAACVVEADSDWRHHATKMAVGAFAYAGQSCISVQRIFVQESIYGEFKDVFLAAVSEKAVTGDPSDAKTLVGPMITKAALDNVVKWVKEAEARGAKLLTPLKVDGQILHPVVLENVPRDAAITCEEAFAPVVVLAPYKSFADGLAAVNDSKFGLQAGVFTSELAKAYQAYDALDVGGVLINQVPTFRTENMPYGGVKDSGFGREGVRYAMEDMTEIKSLVINERGA